MDALDPAAIEELPVRPARIIEKPPTPAVHGVDAIRAKLEKLGVRLDLSPRTGAPVARTERGAMPHDPPGASSRSGPAGPEHLDRYAKAFDANRDILDFCGHRPPLAGTT